MPEKAHNHDLGKMKTDFDEMKTYSVKGKFILNPDEMFVYHRSMMIGKKTNLVRSWKYSRDMFSHRYFEVRHQLMLTTFSYKEILFLNILCIFGNLRETWRFIDKLNGSE